VTDHGAGGRGAAAGVGDFDMTGQRVDQGAGQMRAVGRGKRLVLLALEVVVQDEFVIVLRQDQVDARALEIGIEQEMRVGNDDRIRGRMHMAGIQMDEMRMIPQAFRGNRAVKFASVIQRATTIG
jgi:hypothetical protein